MSDTVTTQVSLDPQAGEDAPNGKEIWSPSEAADNLVRPGYSWTFNNYGELDDGVLTYGFWSFGELMNSYYVNAAGTTAFNEAFYAANYGMFEAFTAAQQAAAAANLELWDDLVSISFELADSVQDADITFGAVYTNPAAGAYAYLPAGSVSDAFYQALYGFEEAGRRSGDVWINWLHNSPTGQDGFLARSPSTSFSVLDPGSYGWFAVTHELGHSLGLAHGGDYNASDDNDGDGQPDPITYEGDAYFFQDSHQYTIMSYFEGDATGAGWVDWQTLKFRMPSTPMVHDILAVQQLYGADETTRSGDTVYGFNSNAGNSVFDFTVNKAPVLTIYDAGGNDTLDLSGWSSDSFIDLNDGAFSSASAGASLAYLKSIGFLPQSYTQSQLEALFASYNTGSEGQMTDNIAIAYGTTIENAVGGAGDDAIVGNEVANLLVGNGGDDLISGGLGGDRLEGGLGDDTLVGGDGVDFFLGGDGADVIVAELNDGLVAAKKGPISLDVVLDFEKGVDKIDLSGIDAKAGEDGHQAFDWVGNASGNKAGEVFAKTFGNMNAAEKSLGMEIDGVDGDSAFTGKVTVVFANTDGGEPEMAMVLANVESITANDFLFI